MPFSSTLCITSFPSHLPLFFHSHKDICILVMFLIFWLYVHPSRLHPILVHSMQSFAVFSVLFSLTALLILKTKSSMLEALAYCIFLCRLHSTWIWSCVYRCHTLGDAAHTRALEKYHLTVLLCSFICVGELQHFYTCSSICGKPGGTGLTTLLSFLLFQEFCSWIQW